jgi:hypothetical protein
MMPVMPRTSVMTLSGLKFALLDNTKWQSPDGGAGTEKVAFAEPGIHVSKWRPEGIGSNGVKCRGMK